MGIIVVESCKLCISRPEGPVSKSVLLVLFFIVSLFASMGFLVKDVAGILFIIVAVAMFAIGFGLWVVFNLFGSEQMYAFFDALDQLHAHRQNPTLTPKQYWNEGKLRPVLRVRIGGYFKKYGIFQDAETSNWVCTGSWGGMVTLMGTDKVSVTTTPKLALYLLESCQPSFTKLAVRSGNIQDVRERYEFELSMEEERTKRADARMEHFATRLAAIELWMDRGKTNNDRWGRWKHAPKLLDRIADAFKFMPYAGDEGIEVCELNSYTAARELLNDEESRAKQESAQEIIIDDISPMPGGSVSGGSPENPATST